MTIELIRISCPDCGHTRRVAKRAYDDIDDIQCWQCMGVFDADEWECDEDE